MSYYNQKGWSWLFHHVCSQINFAESGPSSGKKSFQKAQEPVFNNAIFIFILNILITEQFQNDTHILDF